MCVPDPLQIGACVATFWRRNQLHRSLLIRERERATRRIGSSTSDLRTPSQGMRCCCPQKTRKRVSSTSDSRCATASVYSAEKGQVGWSALFSCLALLFWQHGIYLVTAERLPHDSGIIRNQVPPFGKRVELQKRDKDRAARPWIGAPIPRWSDP